jgi:hypothetical protein
MSLLARIPYWAVSASSILGTVVTWNPTKRAYAGDAGVLDWTLVFASLVLTVYSFYRAYLKWRPSEPA